MVKACPPGVFCIENMTITYIIFIILIIGVYFYYTQQNKNLQSGPQIIIKEKISDSSFFPRFNSGFSNQSGNVLMNPFVAPLKHNGFFPSNMGDPRGIPINIKTRGFDSSYRQVGILTRIDGKESFLPLMGRPLHTNRNKWQYYTMSDKNTSVKLPISRNGRSCTNEYGCDELFNSDTVYVEGYNDAFKVTIYENSEPRYIPFI